jgi:putative FmdB family regulatory protein
MAKRGSKRFTIMPHYTYICLTCSKKFEQFFYIKDYIEKPKCPLCSSKKTERSYIDDLSCVTGSIVKHDSELKNIGDLANRNRDRMSGDQKNELYHKHNQYKESSNKALPKGMSRISKKPKTKWT